MELLTTKDLGEFEGMVEKAQQEASDAINKMRDIEERQGELERSLKEIQARLDFGAKHGQTEEVNMESEAALLKGRVRLLELVLLEVIDMLPIEARGGAIAKMLYTPKVSR